MEPAYYYLIPSEVSREKEQEQHVLTERNCCTLMKDRKQADNQIDLERINYSASFEYDIEITTFLYISYVVIIRIS